MTPMLSAALLVVGCCLAAALSAEVRISELLRERAGPYIEAKVRLPRGVARRWALGPLGLVAASGVGIVLAGLPGGAAGLALASIVPRLHRRRLEGRRLVLAESQLADAVAAISAGLRAGLSLPQSISYAAEEVGAPVGEELRALVDRSHFGVPLGESLERWARSQPGSDGRLVAGVLRLHQRTGGDSPAVLDQVVSTLRDRREAATEVRSLTAQARLSGAILGFLPIGFFLFLSATSRKDIAAAYHSQIGITAIATGFALQAGAFLWIRRLLRVEM